MGHCNQNHVGLGCQWSSGCIKSHPKVTANRISVANLEELLLQQYNHNFNESSQDKVEMSLEDRRFMTIAENSLSLRDCHYALNLPLEKILSYAKQPPGGSAASVQSKKEVPKE